MTVDFYELGDGLDVVDELNGVTVTSSINIPEHKSEKKLLTIKDMMGRKTEARSNSILFYIYDDGIVEKKIIIE